ncbi:unnamed protein product [Penicillium nalgiovense]|uniref:Protein kinase domain-containing protein n=1 Tax=Penicillium nalgiovense TaxID=60175 RepID=A0A9W4HNQ5_PENNA|nr:unnamed protein product [Penicillium nalgiovense]CAG7980266.1 unnamed protein product [Penicillium nalgiovense]CAG7999366.1 unnamed protein product [Penicillium nalgiovense]CAG8010434.1 unnamed protein product [Penicillium nalgiovense]CAG8012509.1 unnamed protein product [Penicillium nalgiovense]
MYSSQKGLINSTEPQLIIPLPNMDGAYCPIDDEGHYIQLHTIIASGDAALVVHREGMAVKMAIVYKHYTLEEAEENRSKIRREQEVWRRIQSDFYTPVEGIVHCLDIPGDTIEMRYMPGGTLLKWLEHRARPSIQLQKRWFRQLAIGLHNLHQCRVIHSDLLSRNILMDGSLNVAICDLGASSVMPIDTVMLDAVDDYNCSIWTDICQLGLVFNEIATGRITGISLYNHGGSDNSVASFPSRDMLPALSKRLWAWDIIETCWREGGYGAAGAAEILAKLDKVKVPCRSR